jgi:hypothetical protein
VIEQTIRQKAAEGFSAIEFPPGPRHDRRDRRSPRAARLHRKLLNFMMNPEIHGESDIERARRAASRK